MFSDRSSLSSTQDDPMSPTTSKRPGHASASEDQEDSDSEHALPPPPPPPKEPISNDGHSPSSPISAGGNLEPPSKSESSNSPGKVSAGAAVHESDTDSASISISSPVFARESPGAEEDGDSDLEFDLGLRRRRTGYRYGGFHKFESDTAIGPTPQEMAEEVPVAANAVASGSGSGSGKRPEDIRTQDRGMSSGRPADVASDRGTIRQEHGGSSRPVPRMERVKSDRKKSLRKGEWVIMDFGNDHGRFFTFDWLGWRVEG